MRTAAELLAILLICFAGCWLLDHEVRSRPTLISGQVIDWNTGQAAPYTEVRIDRLNFSQFAAETDARGRFTFLAPNQPDLYFLFAGAPYYGRLLQTTFGQTVVVYRPGEQVRDLVIPAIPATELSGHVYAMNGQPISGCEVSAITRDNRQAGQFVELNVQGVQAFTYGAPQADDPNQFIDVETERTNDAGSYTFKGLGADRYFVLVRCKQTVNRENLTRFSWEPMAYPQASSISRAQENILLPGGHRFDIDFHMQRKQTYSLKGKVLFSDGSAPDRWKMYSHDLKMFRSDRALTSTWLGQETCDWNANAGTFRCDFVLPGTYTLYFDLSDWPNGSTQFAEVNFTIGGTARQIAPTVQLHNVPADQFVAPRTSPVGFLDLGKACNTAVDNRPAIRVLAWGHGRTGGACYYMTFFGDTRLPLPEDTYIVNAFEASFVAWRTSSLGRNSQFEFFLMQHGTALHIRAGQTSEPVLPILTTKELINIALQSLH